MTLEGVDFSSSRPGGAALVAAGKRFVVRYVPYSGLSKGLTAAEVADYQDHGLAIGLVFESTANRALAGQAAGAADGRTAASAAAGLGFPTTTAIYFGVDFDVTDAQLPAIDAYLAGAAMILGADRIGVYGGRRVVAHVKASSSARWLWQTYAWSGGIVVAGIHLFQYLNGQKINGSSVDLDRAVQADFGAWLPPTTGGGNVSEDDMQITRTKGEDWKPSGVHASGAVFSQPLTSSTRLATLATVIRSHVELVGPDGASWRLVEVAGAVGFIRYKDAAGLLADWTPVTPGGDPAVDKPLHDYLSRLDPPAPAVPTTLAPGLYEVAP